MNGSARKRLTMWASNGLAESQRFDVARGVRLFVEDPPEFAWSGADAAAVTVQTVEPLDGVVAVAFVGLAADGLAVLNGSPLGSGMHPIRPTDRLDFGARSYWLSEDLAPLHTTYDPALHPPDARCYMTKARLQEGQEIVICPGLPGAVCNAIYKEAAWEAVIQSNRDMKCPNCGFRPGEPEWQPPRRRTKKEPLDDLRHFARR